MKIKFFSVLLVLILLFPYQAFALREDLERASREVQEFFMGTAMDDVLIVKGSSISIEEKTLFLLLKSQINIPVATVVNDVYTVKGSLYENKTLVLIGKRTNLLAEDLAYKVEKTSSYPPLVLEFSSYKGKKLLVLYEKKELLNNQNNAIARSPLNKIMDKKYVPLASTFLSILLLYLWSIIGSTLTDFARDFLSAHILQRKAKKHTIKHHEIINLHEIIAILLTILVFAAAMTWTWSESPGQFKEMFIKALLVVGLIEGTREVLRIALSYKHRLRSEYVFWPFGSLLTLLSTFLGNTFALSAFTLLDEDAADEKVFGKFSFIITCLTFLVAVLAYVLNIFRPGIILQLSFAYAIMILFIELSPIHPMPGSEIKQWSFPVWLITYLIVFVSYLFTNFTLYTTNF